MAEPDVDWRSYENWLVPHVEARLFPKWSTEIHSDLLRIAQIENGPLIEAEYRVMYESAIGFLNRQIKNDNLLLFGRPDDPQGEIELIRPNILREVVDWSFQQIPFHNRSVVEFALGQTYRKFYEVYVVPFLAAPGLAKRLQGRIDDLFSYHLWMDVELRGAAGADYFALIEWVKSQGTALKIPISDRIEVVSSDLTRELARSPISVGISNLAVRVLADRLARFFSLMISGEILIAGRRFSDGCLEILPSAIFSSFNLDICILSWVIGEDHEPLWREVRIVDPSGSLAPTLPVCGLTDGVDAAKERPLALDQSGLASTDVITERPRNRPQELDERLPHIDRVLADLLLNGRLPLATKKEFDQLCAQAWQSAGIRLGNDVRKDRKVQTDQLVNDKQVEAAGDWLLAYVPAIRSAVVGKRPVKK